MKFMRWWVNKLYTTSHEGELVIVNSCQAYDEYVPFSLDEGIPPNNKPTQTKLWFHLTQHKFGDWFKSHKTKTARLRLIDVYAAYEYFQHN